MRQPKGFGAGPWIVVATVLAALAAPATAVAQRAPADTSLAALVEHVRTSWGNPALAVAVLSQRRGPESPEKLDALADSMVAMVLAAGREEGDPDAFRHARAAFAVLREAPSYPGGFDALVRIYEGTEDAGFRTAALMDIARRAELGDPAIPFLRDVATSDERAARVAVLLLVGRTDLGPVPGLDLGAEGVAVLRQLHEGGLVTEPGARQVLNGIARERGWDPG